MMWFVIGNHIHLQATNRAQLKS